jgi:predicted XRE-type DNA-binding protein
MNAVYDNRIPYAMADTTFALDAAMRSLHSVEMRSEAEIREALRAQLDAKAIRQSDIAAALGVQQPNAQKLFTPDKNGKLRRISYDEGLKLIQRFHLAADIPPQSPKINEEILARLIYELGPAIPRDGVSESAAQSLAVAVSYAFELLQETGASEPTDREIAMAVRAAIAQSRGAAPS